MFVRSPMCVKIERQAPQVLVASRNVMVTAAGGMYNLQRYT